MVDTRRWHTRTALLITWSLATSTLIATGITAPVVAESRAGIAPILPQKQYIAQNQTDNFHYAVVEPADDSRVPQKLRKLYKEDAARLALRLIQAAEPESEEVELPAKLVQTLYNVLIHVYNATNLPARDAVVQTYEIHTFPRPSTRSLTVHVDPPTAWVAAWRKGKRLTGNSQVDALMKTFGLRLVSYSENNVLDLAYAVLEAERSLNIAALAKRFTRIMGVRYALSDIVGDGNDINAQSVKNYWQLDYSLGDGDCPSGCIYRHIWTFRVAKNGLVKHVGSYGTLPPEQDSIQLKIYSNPK